MGHEKVKKDSEGALLEKSKPSVLSIPAGFNQCAFWRILWPLYHLHIRDFVSYSLSIGFLRDSVSYKRADVVQIQRVTDPVGAKFIEMLCTLKKDLDFRLVYDIDDVLIQKDIPDFNLVHSRTDVDVSAMETVINLCDEVTVSTPYLKEYYLDKFDQNNYTVLPNRTPYAWAGNFYDERQLLQNYKTHKNRPRILYAGAHSHINCDGKTGNDDFTHVINEIKKTIKEFKWVFFGVLPWELIEENEAGDIEFYGLETIDNYHKRIAVLQCSMMIVPLKDIPFNHAKSDIKFQEACAHGLPVTCQDITPYKHAPIRFSTGDQMIETIRKTLKSEGSFLSASRRGRAHVDNQWLEAEQNISLHKELFAYPYQDPRRKFLNKLNGREEG